MYKDIVSKGDELRKTYSDGLKKFITRMNNEGYQKREDFMPTYDFPEKAEFFRKKYIEMLGIDKIDSSDCEKPTMEFAGEDDDCRIYRVTVGITKEVPMYGLLMVPHGIKKARHRKCGAKPI